MVQVLQLPSLQWKISLKHQSQITCSLGMRTCCRGLGQLECLWDAATYRRTQIFVLSLRGPHWAFTRNSSPPPASSEEEEFCHGSCGEQMLRGKVTTGQWPEVLVGAFLDVTELLFPMATEQSSACPAPVSASPGVNVGQLTHRAFVCSCQTFGARLAGEGTQV